MELAIGVPNDPFEAIEVLSWVLERDPASADARIGLIGFQLAVGKFEEANVNYFVLKRIVPNSDYVKGVEARRARAASVGSPSPPEPPGQVPHNP